MPPIITCHVLDTVKGRPAAGIKVQLSLQSMRDVEQGVGPSDLSNLPRDWQGTTNSDGRVTTWRALEQQEAPETLLEKWLVSGRVAGLRTLVWSLKFEVGEYFGKPEDSFWDVLEVRFKTGLVGEDQERNHWHVPLLLSPWSYTTYRGS